MASVAVQDMTAMRPHRLAPHSAGKQGAPRNAARNAEIIRLRREGQAPIKIATALGLSRDVISGVLQRACLTDSGSVKARGRGWDYTPEQRSAAVALAQQVGYLAAAEKLGLPRTTVHQWVRKAAS